MPTINSSLSYSAVSDDFGSLNDAIKDDWSFGMNVSIGIPIYTAGRNLIMQQHQAKISIDQSEHSYLNLLNDLKVQAEQIKESLENFSEIIPINESVVNSAEEDLKLVRERYSLGSATILEVLDAQVSLFHPIQHLINSIHNARILEANFKAILGSLDLEYKNKINKMISFLKKKKIWIPFSIIIAFLFLVFPFKKESDNIIYVDVEEVQRRDVVQKVNASGKIQPEEAVQITSTITGWITKITVIEGDTVNPGQHLISIDEKQIRPTYDNALSQVKSSKANLKKD